MKFIFILLFSLHANALTGSTYDVMNVNTLDKSKLNFSGQKITGTASAGVVTDIDFLLTDDHLITGARLTTVGACADDEVKFHVVSGTTIVNTFIDWYVMNGIDRDLLYPAKIPGGLKLRVAYKNTCTTAVKVFINYNLHKILI